MRKLQERNNKVGNKRKTINYEEITRKNVEKTKIKENMTK